MRFVPNCVSFRTCFYAVCGWKPSSRYVVSASLSARLRRERKADEKTERFNRMLDVCVAAEDFLGAERIFQRLVKDRSDVPNELSFGLLVAASASVRDLCRAEMWLQRFARAKLDPAIRQHPKVTQSLIAAGARSMVEDEGMPQSAKLRFETLIATSRGSALSDSKLQEVEGAFQDALEESQGLSIVTKHLYQELLGFLARSGQSEQIQARLKEMKLGGFPADQVTYGIIINALASSAFASLASSFFRQAEQEGIALTLPLCNAMLKASGSAGDLQAAEAFLEKIYGASLRPNIISFNNLLGACAVVGSLSEARKVLERMRQAAVAPDGFSYLWMIKAAGRQGGEVAERCLAEAKASGVELGCGMYNAVLRAYLAETPERPEEVKRLFGEMQELQVSPDAMSYLALANAYAMQNDVQQAEDLIFQGRRLGGALDSLSPPKWSMHGSSRRVFWRFLVSFQCTS